MDRQKTLESRVKAVNRAGEYANTLHSSLVEKFRPLLGLKIVKADGSLLAKYAHLVKDLPHKAELTVYRHHSVYSLAWTVKTCESIEDCGCVYHEVTVYVGNLRGDTLTELSEPQNYRTDYTAEEVEAKREAYRKAKEVAENALSALYPFGEFDR